MQERGQTLPEDVRYLGLGVGQAYPEVALAKGLGVPPERAVFVDKRFRAYALDRLATDFPAVQTVTSGIFAFLETTAEKDFSIVSAFGIEYAISADDQIRPFIELMPRLMRVGGIVAISFYHAGNVDEHWRRKGFQPVVGYSGPFCSDLYVFNPVVSIANIPKKV